MYKGKSPDFEVLICGCLVKLWTGFWNAFY